MDASSSANLAAFAAEFNVVLVFELNIAVVVLSLMGRMCGAAFGVLL